jgi:hypothetical protein
MPAKISGEGYASLHVNASDRHDAAFDNAVATLPIGGFYKTREIFRDFQPEFVTGFADHEYFNPQLIGGIHLIH